jgi:hypothetical protein
VSHHQQLKAEQKGGDMYKVKHIFAGLVVLAGALVAATTALGFTGPPVVNQQFRPPQDVHPQTWCGEVEGTAVDTVVEHYMQDANGNIIDNVRFTSLFTATATGSRSLLGVSTRIDETSTTTARSASSEITGLVLKFQIPGGPVLKAANGDRSAAPAF